jgi:hypothetical protein
LVWDIWDDATIEQQGGGTAALRFLYQVGQIFLCTADGNKTWSFYPDYRGTDEISQIRNLQLAA